ncbi:GPP34 family phosphoprotein [Streptomyces sp. CHD11]|uniref:GOLPH3/VPS74 family protein n=1 Tax=Streptomyces sp. CHD11 TaxID=2741325 RepID=UPI001BFC01B5|nr:GPP34 family phosphoprotein [Streptomyces sp. CHD11]MBT3149367.1 GPP34 family phosphoprotein [Streptomyces sp. CHD11]
MTTARDLTIIAAGPETHPAVEQGDLSLALAGAELIDLIDSRTVTLEGDRLVPGATPEPDDPVLREAASALLRQTPYETVEEWLWRRGRDLAARYRALLEAEGLVAPARPHRLPFRRARPASPDAPALRRAAERWSTGEPVLLGLAAAVGVTDHADHTPPTGLTDDQGVVVGTVYDAVTQLAAARQRSSIEQAAFDNIWRGE